MRTAVLLLALSLTVNALADEPSSYEAEIQSWRKAREARLRGDEGWLTVAGLFWLKEGDNRFGTDPSAEIVLPPKSASAHAGVFRLQKGHVTVELAPGTVATLAGKPITRGELRADVPGPA